MQNFYYSLASGSSGNCAVWSAGGTAVLIDAGISFRAINQGLSAVGLTFSDLSAVLLTHEHTDHIKGLATFTKKYDLPVYATFGTAAAILQKLPQAEKNLRTFAGGEQFEIDGLHVRSMPIPHDAAEPVGYRVFYGGRSVGVATDMGQMQKRVIKALAGCDLQLLESNHDPDLLMQNPHYSLYLKQRILGSHGHLSNDASAQALLALYETGVRQVLLGHLSGENNTPELALQTATEKLAAAGVRINEDIGLGIAWRDRVSRRFEIG